MARSGRSVDESIACAGIGAGTASERLLQITSPSYRAVNVGANRFQFARTYRPGWSLFLGIALAPTLAGLLFLLIKSSETWTATVEEDHRHVSVRIQGRVLPAVLLALRDGLTSGVPDAAVPAAGLLADPVATPSGPVDGVPPRAPSPTPWLSDPPVEAGLASSPASSPGFDPPAVVLPPPPPGSSAFVPPPVPPLVPLPAPSAPPVPLLAPPSAPSPSVPASPPPRPEPRPEPATAPVAPVSAEPAGVVALPPLSMDLPPAARRLGGPQSASQRPATAPPAKVSPSKSASSSTPGLPPVTSDNRTRRLPIRTWLGFDTGQRLEIAPLMLVGRAPEPAEGEGTATLIPVDDPDRSVSKTHLVLCADHEGIWVVDRGSTNGTSVESKDGMSTSLIPGEPCRVAPGQTVRFGQRCFTISEAVA